MEEGLFLLIEGSKNSLLSYRDETFAMPPSKHRMNAEAAISVVDGRVHAISEEPQLLRSQVPNKMLEQGRLLEASSHTWLKPDPYFNE